MVAISADDVETLKRFKAERKAPFPFLSDTEKTVIPKWSGTIAVVGLANRANYLVGRDGRILSLVEGSAAIDPSSTVAACSAAH